MVQSAPAQKYSSLPPALTVPQSSPRYPEVIEPQHDLSCFASHVRISAQPPPDGGLAWQGGYFVPRCIPRSKGVPPRAPLTGASPLRPYQGAFVPLGTQTKAVPPWNLTRGFRTPGPRPEGLRPWTPARGDGAAQRGVFAPPSPTTQGASPSAHTAIRPLGTTAPGHGGPCPSQTENKSAQPAQTLARNQNKRSTEYDGPEEQGGNTLPSQPR